MHPAQLRNYIIKSNFERIYIVVYDEDKLDLQE